MDPYGTPVVTGRKCIGVQALGGGGERRLLLPPQKKKLGQLRFFGQQEKFGQSQFFKDVSKLFKFTRHSGYLARDELLVISKS